MIEDVHWHTVHAVTPHSIHVFVNTSDVALPQSCKTRFAGDPQGGLDVGVALCGDSDGAASTRAPASTSPSFAMCIPALYGDAASYAAITRHLHHHQRLGVQHSFLYVHAKWLAESPASRNGTRLASHNVSLLSLAWLSRFKLHQRGQLFQINDCIHRAASRGLTWTLNIDLDEFAFLYEVVNPRKPHLTGDAHAIQLGTLVEQEGSKSNASVLTFGARFVKSFVENGTLAAVTSAKSHLLGGLIFCLSSRHVWVAWTCSGYLGRRKHLTHTKRVWLAGIHHVPHCKAGNCSVRHLDARHKWLMHLRGNASRVYRGMPAG